MAICTTYILEYGEKVLRRTFPVHKLVTSDAQLDLRYTMFKHAPAATEI